MVGEMRLPSLRKAGKAGAWQAGSIGLIGTGLIAAGIGLVQ